MGIKDFIRRWLLDDGRKVNEIRDALRSRDDLPSTNLTRQFNIHVALNGNYIEFTRRKYNPNGPDEFMREVYLVQSGESLVDAISTVLVLTEK